MGETVPRRSRARPHAGGNRLNVAISRARGLAILVANPALLTLHACTPEQLRLANAFCRLAEVAAEQTQEPMAELAADVAASPVAAVP